MQRSAALSLYRSLLREAGQMPTANRAELVRRRAREGFEAGRAAEGAALRELVALGQVQLESARVQRALLCALRDQGNLKGPR
ncbi:MAG: hypothetical protein J3K34DRAFT_440178 [Monoraphidium minutum]|nr:MAG: hypothetical protein J3K34DRAFT_440178 [Monoraphidium minutum]